jgi:hypothetical protein
LNAKDDTSLNPETLRPTKRSLPAPLAGGLALAVLAIAGAAGAEAASVTLNPSATVVNPSGTLSVTLGLNAADAPGAHPGRYGGSIVVDYDPLLLSFGQFNFAAGVTQTSAPGIGTAGTRRTITLGFDQALDAGTIGTFTFSVLNKPGNVAALNLADADSLFGTFITHLPTNQAFCPTFTGTSVSITAVPLPAGAGLIVSALATLGAGLHRRRREASGG